MTRRRDERRFITAQKRNELGNASTVIPLKNDVDVVFDRGKGIRNGGRAAAAVQEGLVVLRATPPVQTQQR